MNQHHPALLSEIETFLAETGMGASYFGKAATKNSEVVARLRQNRRIWPETEANIREFMASYPQKRISVNPSRPDLVSN